MYGPHGLKDLMGAMRIVYGRMPYELSFVELQPAETVQRDGYRSPRSPCATRRAAFGYALVEASRPGTSTRVWREELGVHPGPDFGRLQRGETVAGVKPEQVDGAHPRGPQGRAIRRY